MLTTSHANVKAALTDGIGTKPLLHYVGCYEWTLASRKVYYISQENNFTCISYWRTNYIGDSVFTLFFLFLVVS